MGTIRAQAAEDSCNDCFREIYAAVLNGRLWADCGSFTDCRFRPQAAGRDRPLSGRPVQRPESLGHTADPHEKAAHDRCCSSRAPKVDSGPWSRVYAQNSHWSLNKETVHG